MKNRYDDALPYDHSRVILNALANVNGLDYINASLIVYYDIVNSCLFINEFSLIILD